MKIKNWIWILTLWMMGCGEEDDQNLRTDLPTEAQQIFSVSKIQNEHLFLALTSWEEFTSIDPSSLPGCPTLVLEQESKRVTLNYSNSEACEVSQVRSGSIVLDLALQESDSQEWFMEFADYSYEGDTLKGIKVFKKISNQVISQSFENLKVTSTQNASFVLQGELTHTKPPIIGPSVSLLSTTGQITGKNPIGRSVSMNVTEPILSVRSCQLSQKDLPTSGTETWEIERGNRNSVSHWLSYESTGICETVAKMQLSDGRVLILNP